MYSRADHAAIKARFCTHIQGIHLLHEGFTVFLHLLNIANNLPADAPPSVTGLLVHIKCFCAYLMSCKLCLNAYSSSSDQLQQNYILVKSERQ